MDRQRRCDRPRSEVQVSKKPSLQLVSMCGLYRSIEFGGERYTVGDHVLLRGTKMELICRLTGFSRNTTDDQATADVEWLYWPEEMTRELRNIPARKRPKLPDHTPNEVFTSDSRETIGVGTILSKVSVVCVPRFYPLSPTRHSGNQYCARWHWNTRAKKFTPVSDDDSMRKGSLLSAILTYQTPTKSSSQRTIHQTPTKSTARHTPLKTPTTNHKSTSQHAHITTPATNHRSTKQRTTPPKPHSKSSSVKKGLVREVSVSLSRSPIICRSPSQQRSNASPKSSQPLSSLNPRHNEAKNRAKGKPTPGRGVLISKTPDQPRKRSTRSTQSARISHADCVDILTNGVNGHMDEMPLPPISGRAPNSTKSQSDRGRERTRDAGKKEGHMETTPKRESRLNTSDVLDLLGDEGEVEGFEEEEDELIGDPGTATDKEVGKNQKVVRGRGELTLPGSDRHSEKHEKGASECTSESKESEKRLETAKTKKMGTTRKGEEEKKKVRCKSNKTTAGTLAGGTTGASGQVKVPEDILTSPKKGLVDEDILTTPSGKKWSLRARSEVKPPTYLSNNMAGKPLPISEELAGLKRKRDRSPTRLLDILISEPEEKKMKHTTTPAHTAENRSGTTQNHKKSRGKCAQEGEMKGGYRGSESGAVHRTPEKKPRPVKPHTLPRRKKPTSTDVTVEDSTTPVTRHQLRRNRREILRLEPANSSKYLSEKLSRKRRLSGQVDWDKISEESESDGDDVEYELSGEEPVSDSETEEEEEEEEEESDFSFEGGLMSHTPGSVSNWSPDHSIIAKKTPRISHQKITRKTKTPSKTPHSQAASRRTPGARTPGGRTPARRTPGARTPSKRTPSKRTPARRTPARRTPGARTPGARTPSKRTPARRTPGARTPARRTPGARTPAKRTPGGRVVPTPHIPERRKNTGRMGNSNFDKVRQR